MAALNRSMVGMQGRIIIWKRGTEITQFQQQREKYSEEKKKHLWGCNKRFTIHVIRLPEREEKESWTEKAPKKKKR